MSYNAYRRSKRVAGILFLVAASSCFVNKACADLNTIGVNLLRTVTTNLDGSGIWVVQAEADVNTNLPPTFEVNPGAVGNPPGIFSYFSGVGMAGFFPNSVGGESWHANSVGGFFYGLSGGVATNVVHVDNYDADYFINSVVAKVAPLNGRVVNQSFIFQSSTIAQQQMIDSAYDNYAAQFSTLFVSGIGNGGAVNPPSTCYNGIGVAAYGGSSSIGPTPDNGRAKPDITVPAGATSFSTPQVSGAAALLLQAGLRGDSGSDTNSAADIRTVKALLLNGAIKPADWTNSVTSPLDARYGAGVLNVFNSYEQLAHGKQGFIVSSSVPTNSPHPAVIATGVANGASGWDLNTVSSSTASDGINNYFFNLTNTISPGTFTATVTLVWNRQNGQTDINNLDLFLYNTDSGQLVGASTSSVDNVEHLFVMQLVPGHYNLQVLKHGGATVSTNEIYALAFEFFSMQLGIASSGGNLVVSWPVYPTGFVLQSTTNIAAPVWSTNNPVPVVTGNQFSVTLPVSDGGQFFRLSRP
jgi:hypothetical protein